MWGSFKWGICFKAFYFSQYLLQPWFTLCDGMLKGVMSGSVDRPKVVGHRNCVASWDRVYWKRHPDVVGVWNPLVAGHSSSPDLILGLQVCRPCSSPAEWGRPFGFAGGIKAVLCSCAEAGWLGVEWLEEGRLCSTQLPWFSSFPPRVSSAVVQRLCWPGGHPGTVLERALWWKLCTSRGCRWFYVSGVWPVPREPVDMRLRHAKMRLPSNWGSETPPFYLGQVM